jgi:hypothetical protein
MTGAAVVVRRNFKAHSSQPGNCEGATGKGGGSKRMPVSNDFANLQEVELRLLLYKQREEKS